ncbi:MAG: hypothetical protein HKO01_04550 [Flaviramulus sp.]|nr:hypothetical protein [Flaviramulus sp.]NNC49784.1 hypothetical protein [Flaviramulus sp.]
MKKLIYISFISLLFIGCKNQSGTNSIETEIKITQKIANAHGFENWKNVSEVSFTFNGKRSWKWNTRTDDITLITSKDTIFYNRKFIDSLSINADKAFINDKFWLLVPFQLVWDKGTTISLLSKENAPISKTELNKITLLYSNEVGYTPGDAYDIYFDNDYLIKEWVFRKGNQNEPTLANTFEKYQDFNGIKIALEHKNAEGNWNLKFTDVIINLN